MKNRLLITTFFLFLLVRIFVSAPVYFISLDEAKYLALAAAFPRHALFNNQLYLVHPPFFPYSIRLFSLVFPDHIAGMTVSLVFAVVTFWSLVGLYRLLGKDRYWIIIALFVLVVSPLHIPTSRVVYKDSMFLGLFTLSLYLFIRGVYCPSGSSLLGAGLSGAVCALTSDLAMTLLPCFVLGYLLFHRPGLRPVAILLPVLLLLIAYGNWLLLRWIIFTKNIFYPVGVDGTLEYVRDFSLR